MAVKFQDYYVTLGVARTASAEEIKLAFRKLARIHHPDVAKDKVAGEVKFKEINEAYEVLGDPEKRRRYDELGPDWQDSGNSSAAGGSPRGRTHAPQGGQGFEFNGSTGFSDFFESFFGGGRDGFGSRHHAQERAGGDGEAFAQPGQDVEADLLVALEEILRGARRKVSLRRPGLDGEVARTNTYQVRIPAGIREGQRIRLAGQGSAGHGGAQAGDLYLRVRLARHPDFNVQGADLHYDLDLAPWEAVLGVKVKIPMLDGATSLTVPPGTAAGSQLRLRGLGLPKGGGVRGDLYASVRIQTPHSVPPEERAAWENLAAVSTFKPRNPS
ncbi:MAG TPA: J domain-containing protein [Rariglobus sp.]|jgi:curved DNA-binding protein|nr:J domain-containing protein [Rariglobus sp.]